MTKYASVCLRFKSLSSLRQNDIIKIATFITKKIVISNSKIPFLVSNFLIEISHFITEIVLLGNWLLLWLTEIGINWNYLRNYLRNFYSFANCQHFI